MLIFATIKKNKRKMVVIGQKTGHFSLFVWKNGICPNNPFNFNKKKL